MSNKIYDITIVGGGPVGIYAAFYAGMQGLETKLVDSLSQLGGQLAAVYPEKYIYDLPGHEKIRANDFINQLKKQMSTYEEKIDVSTETTVTHVEKLADTTFKITTTGEEFITRSVLITAGNGAFTPRKLEVESDQFSNIHYFVTDMSAFKDKNVVIFGGGDSAVDWALMLEDVAKNISVVHRREEFRAHAGSVDKMKASDKIKLYTSYKADSLEGMTDVANKVVLAHLESGETVEVDADDVIVLFGFVSSLGPIKEWGIDLNKTALTVGPLNQTSVDGIYAAGDAASYDGKIKMITAGFGEAVVAINASKSYAYPDKVHRHQHSSTIAGK